MRPGVARRYAGKPHRQSATFRASTIPAKAEVDRLSAQRPAEAFAQMELRQPLALSCLLRLGIAAVRTNDRFGPLHLQDPWCDRTAGMGRKYPSLGQIQHCHFALRRIRTLDPMRTKLRCPLRLLFRSLGSALAHSGSSNDKGRRYWHAVPFVRSMILCDRFCHARSDCLNGRGRLR